MKAESQTRAVQALAMAGFLAWCVLIQALLPLPDRGGDFPAFYTAAQAPLASLYDLDYFARSQSELRRPWGPHEVQPFPRAPVYAVLLRPLGLLSYRAALHAWLALLSAGMLGCAWLLRKLYGAGPAVWLAMIGYYPISLSLAWGQDSAFVLAPLLLALLFHRTGRDRAAAFFLSLAFQKFHLLLLVPLVLLLHGKRALAGRLACWCGFWGAVSLALIGAAGVESYLRVLGAGVVDRLFARSWNLRSLAFHFGWGRLGYVIAALLLVVWFVWLIRRLRFEMAFWSAVALSLLLAWHSFKYDYALAFPFFYLLWREHRIWLAALFLGGGLWAHAFALAGHTWILAPLVAGSTVMLWRRTHSARISRHMPPSPEVLGVPEGSH